VEPTGLIVVDKPAGITSHDVVARIRRLAKTRRVGHGGTLDPMATGVLVIGVGRATRLLTYVIGADKGYTATIRLGQSTVTDDAEGDVTGRQPASVPPADVDTAVAALTGDILQVPSAVSAIKVAGRRSYARVRSGEHVELAARPVTVHRFEVGEPVGDGCYPIEVECSSGTYIRSLAADVGTALGGGAHLRRLRRTAVGGFKAGVRLEELGPEHVLAPAAAVAHLAPVTVDAGLAEAVSYGKVLEADWGGEGPWAVLGEGGALLAVYEPYGDGRVKPSVVLAAH
jgi:tRNA pseudouridine55 synthase